MSDWNPQANEIFLNAREIASPSEQAAYIEQACQGRPELRSVVQSLLAANSSAGSFLESPPSAVAVAIEERAATELYRPITEGPGTQIGPYKLLQQIGEGGFGLVYMAEQHEPVRRKVALKIIKPGMDTKEVIARFESERQALALMDHPNIAKVLDAGTTGSGRPYFVMELVKGIPITAYCDDNRLPPKERLKLFILICNAVQHAHQKGVIHRDLKPSNVLVTLHDDRPVPKVIDFGVAKATSQQLTERTLFTAFGQMIGTPAYMSPEQAVLSGLDIDTRSDVYSCGVLLYELLTGTTPFDSKTLRAAGFDEMRRIIREEEPETVSSRIARTGRVGSAHQDASGGHSPPYTSRGARSAGTNPKSKIQNPKYSEMDWIVAKSLEKDRNRRYESAAAFAADVQRYLNDEPVLACPPTTMYRFQKFARKHKAALTTAAATATCLILGTTVSAWQAARARTAEVQANANAAEAQDKAKEATEQRDEVEKQRDEVRALANRLQRTLYASNMNLAKNAWDAGNVGRANDLLEQHRPEAGEADLRGFEWHYLYRLCHSELLTFRGTSVAVSPDGKRLAVASDNNVKICDAQTGQELVTFPAAASSIVFSPDGNRLASAHYDETTKESTAKVWDARTGQENFTTKAHTGYIRSVVFSPDGKRLATGSRSLSGKGEPGETKVWDSETGQEIYSVRGDANSLAYSPDGERLVVASGRTDVKVSDARTGQDILSLSTNAGHVAFSPDRKHVATAGGARVQLWDAQTGQFVRSLGRGDYLAISPDGKRVATASAEETIIRVRDAESGEEIQTLKGHTGVALAVIFSPDGKKLVSRSRDGTVRVWDVTTSREVPKLSGDAGGFRIVSFSPDGKRLAGVSRGPGAAALKVWDIPSGQEIFSIKENVGQISCVAFSPDGNRLAAGFGTKDTAQDRWVAGEVKVWDVNTRQNFVTFTGHSTAVVSVAFSPDARRVVSAGGRPSGFNSAGDPGEPGEVKVWDSETGDEVHILQGHKRFVNCVAFSPDGKRLATVSRDQTLKVWDAQTGRDILTLKVSGAGGGAIAFSPDGKRLVNSSFSFQSRLLGEVKVWNSDSGEELLTLKGHDVPVNSIVFSPDGRRLVTGAGWIGPNGELKVWHAGSGQELLTLEGRSDSSNDVAFSPDGHRLTGRGKDGAIRFWDATPLPEKP